MPDRRIIYDVGSNNGDDIPYYLLKGDKVVAIEANPMLCDIIEQRFAEEIRAGRLVLERCVVTAHEGAGEVDFYVHNENHVLSQFPPPPDLKLGEYMRCRLVSRAITDIINEHGDPYYVKIDIEHYDAELLRAIIGEGVRPPFVSAECHSLEAFLVLAETGGYGAFKLVDGRTVSSVYVDRGIRDEQTQRLVHYSFPFHSAGPFGNDIDGNWMTAEHFMTLLAFEGLGWKDVHATTTEAPDPSLQPRVVDHLDRLARVDELVPYVASRIVRSVRGQARRLLSR